MCAIHLWGFFLCSLLFVNVFCLRFSNFRASKFQILWKSCFFFFVPCKKNSCIDHLCSGKKKGGGDRGVLGIFSIETPDYFRPVNHDYFYCLVYNQTLYCFRDFCASSVKQISDLRFTILIITFWYWSILISNTYCVVPESCYSFDASYQFFFSWYQLKIRIRVLHLEIY